MSEKVVRTVTGQAVADSRDKTVKVRVVRRTIHPLYGKVIQRRNYFLAHDEDNRCKAGDTVKLRESRRFSKRKSWLVVEAQGGGQ